MVDLVCVSDKIERKLPRTPYLPLNGLGPKTP